MSILFRTAKTVAKVGLRYHFSRGNIRGAKSKLAKLEATYGPLNPADRKRCDAYAVEVLGDAKYAHWLYVYAHVAGEYRDGWIPDNFYAECVLPHTSAKYGELCSFRALNTALFDMPEFPDLAAQVNGMIVDRSGKTVARKDLADLLFAKTDRVIFKSDSSQSGVGIKVLDRAGFDPAGVQAFGPGLFQSFIRQHEVFQRLGNVPAVATLRLTTAADESGQIGLRGAYVRFAQGNAAYLQSAEEVNAVVDRMTGDLSPVGYLPGWLRTDRHPQSDVPFAGHSIPNFQDCKAAALRCHAKIPYVRCIGWDMCVDTEGAVQIMEWNGGHNGIKFTEATQGPCFADLDWHRLRRPG
jgi:hypothetical protein